MRFIISTLTIISLMGFSMAASANHSHHQHTAKKIDLEKVSLPNNTHHEKAVKHHPEGITHHKKTSQRSSHHHTDHFSHHTTPFVFGLKGGMLFEGEEVQEHTSIQPYGGGSFFVELELNHQFELELAGGFYGTNGIVHFPVELVLKMPFHVNHIFVPFVELGPMVSFSFHTESTESHTTTTTAEEEHVHLGAQLVTGSNIWLDPHWGLEFGLSAEMLVVQGHPHFGAGFHTGVLYRL